MPKAKKASVPVRKESSRYENHAYINPDGTIDGERLLNLVSNAPGAFDLIMLNAVAGRGTIEYEYHYIVREIVSGLTSLVMLARHGDERAATQIKAIQKLVDPEKYGLGITFIEEIVNKHHTRAALARANEVRMIMHTISRFLVSARGDVKDLWNVKKTARVVVRRIEVKEEELKEFTAWEREYYELVRKHCRKHGSTLQSVAIAIYREKLKGEGLIDDKDLDISSIKRDLRELREWEEAHPDRANALYHDFSDEWKARKLKRRNTTNS